MSETNDHGRDGTLSDGLQASAANGGKSIDVVFDLNQPGSSETLVGYRSAFGNGYSEVVPLGDGRVVLKLYPGGTRRLL